MVSWLRKMKGWLGKTPLEQTVRGLLLAVIFLLPFGVVFILSESHAEVTGRYNQFAVPKLYLVELLVIAAGMLWLWLRRQPPGGLWPFRLLLIVTGIAGTSFIWAPYPELAIVAAGHLATAFILLYVLATEFRDKAFLQTAIWTLTASAAIQAIWATGQFLVGHDFGLQRLGESALNGGLQNVAKVGDGHIRAYGSLPHPNLLAAFLATAIFWVGTVIFWPFAKRSRLAQAGLAGLLVILGTALVLTFSRVAMLIVLVNGLLVALFSYRRWHRLPAGAAVAAIGVFIVALLAFPMLSSRGQVETSKETGLSNRAAGLELAGSMISNRPAGVGAGNFVLAAPELRELPAYQYQPVHNVPALIGAELGGVAALLMLWFVVRVGWVFHQLAPRDRQESTLNFSLFALAGACIAMGLTDHFFWSSAQGLLLIAIIMAAVISRIPAAQWRRI